MSRIFLLSVCLLVLALAPVSAPAAQNETLAHVVPDGAVYYADVQNLDGFWRSIEQSNFWAKFTRLKIWDDVSFDWYEEFREEFAENLGFEFSTANVMAVFGKELALAFYVEPAKEGEAGPQIELILVARADPPEAVEDMVGKVLKSIKEHGDDDVLLTSVEHQGAKIHTVTLKDNSSPIQFRLAVKDGMLLVGVGNGVPRIEACLDCMTDAGSPLADNPEVRKLLDMARQDRGTFFGEAYFNVDKFGQVLSALVGSQPEMEPVANMLGMMGGSTKAIAATTHLDNGLRIKMVTEPGPLMNEMMPLILKAKPSRGTHVKYVRPDALFYYGANSMPPPGETWPHVMKMYSQMGIDQMVTDVVEQMELALDIDFKADLLDNIGTEMAVVVEGLDLESGPFPFPKLAILVQVKDTAKAQTLIDKLIGFIKANVPPDQELEITDLAHQGAALKVVHVPVAPGIEVAPVIGITENFLFISSGQQYAKATLNTARMGPNLASAALVRSLGIPEETNSVMLFNMEEFMSTARKVVDWAVAMAEARGGGDQMNEQVDEYVLPLIDCFSVLKAIVTYGVVTPESTSAVFIVRVQDLPAE